MAALKIGVIGVGAIGRNHARILAALEEADLVAICDSDAETAKEIADAHGTRSVGSVEELLPLVDAVTLATPTVTHHKIGSQLLKAGKHVLIEKPITTNPDEAQDLVSLARDHDRILQVGHIERFNPVMRELEAKLTAPRFIEAHRLSPFPNRSMDIGVVLDVMIHDIEIILHLVKSKIESIDAVGVPVLTRREDIANARIRFEDGCVANITASRISPEKMRKIRVFQGDAYLSLDYQEQSGEVFRKEGMQIVKDEVSVEKDEPLKLELAEFVACAASGQQPRVSGRQGAAALDVAVRITQLIEENNRKSG